MSDADMHALMMFGIITLTILVMARRVIGPYIAMAAFGTGVIAFWFAVIVAAFKVVKFAWALA